ncbi:MAG: ABC transporter transmembrane domain-containing protein, partial [Alphaproteobacteria bacterium]|nr:ABC transporter transmembrane domain-containing protein [Alphaproteobacteria bacterium]
MTVGAFTAVAPTSMQDIENLLSALRSRHWLGRAPEGRTCLSHYLPPLLSALGWTGSINRVALAMPHKPSGMDLVDLLNTLAGVGWSASPLRQALEHLDRRLLPLVFLPDGSFGERAGPLLVLGSTETDGGDDLVCYRIEGDGLAPTSPPKGILGSAYIFRKTEGERSGSVAAAQRATGGSWFRITLERFRSTLSQIFMISLLLNSVSLATPIFVMLVYDIIIGGLSTNGLGYLVLGVVLAIGVEAALRYIRLRSIAWLGSRADYIVNVSIFDRLVHIPPMYTERSSVSADIARIKAFESVRDFFTSPTLIAILELPFVIVLLICIAVLAGPVAAIPVVLIGIYLAMLAYLRPKLRQAIWLAAKANSEKEKMTVETFSKIEGMRFNGIDYAWLERFREASGAASFASFRAAFLASIIETMAHGLSILAGVATITVGVGRIWAGDMTIGALIASL